MGDNQRDDSDASLELPSIFGRRKKAEAAPAAPRPETAEATSSGERVEPKPAKAPKPPKPERAPRPEPTTDEDREFKLPPLPARVAAIITGVLVGVLGTLMTWGSLEACEQVRGTDSCGGAGFFLLLVILLLMILAGGALLAAWDVSDPRSTSALGVGIVCILVLLLLMEELFDAWMFAVVPVISAIAYYAAHWVTTALVDETELEKEQPSHDVR